MSSVAIWRKQYKLFNNVGMSSEMAGKKEAAALSLSASYVTNVAKAKIVSLMKSNHLSRNTAWRLISVYRRKSEMSKMPVPIKRHQKA
jgi:hypothetical protein